MADLRSILAQAGFSGQSLNMAYAIAMAESGGNARAFNGNRSTGDQSYGLFQINMLGGMGPERRRQFGLSSNDDLYDMVTNAKVAYKMSKGGTDWSPWSTFKRGDYQKYMGQSGAQVGGGDAKPATPGAPAAPAAPENRGPQDIINSFTAPGLAAPDQDPFAPQQGDPFGAKKSDPAAPPAAQDGTTGQPGAAHGPVSSTSFRDKAITAAMRYIGTPYSWGGGGVGGPSAGFAQGAGIVGFDCSSLLQYAYAQAGYHIPRVSYDQLKQGGRTSLDKLQPGDFVGFGDGGHIAIWLGNGQILEAPHTGATVRVRTIGRNENAWGVHLNLPGD
ncbi:MAG TPA: NlpC/P60 family protein [Nocardioidaceae bacterium]|nr:NlpC/P60 family protein [Nocardioidaceae bacterium]